MRVLTVFILFVLLVFFSHDSPGKGQGKDADSVKSMQQLKKLLHGADSSTKVKIYNRISWKYRNSSLERSIEFARKALDLAIELKDDTALSETYDYMGIAYYLHGDYQQSLKYYLESLLIKEALNDTASIVLTYNNLGILYSRLNNYNEALRYFKKCYAIHKENKDSTHIGSALNNLGSLYTDLKVADSAGYYHQKALNIRTALKDTNGIAYSLKNLSNAYRMQGNYEAAFYNYYKVLTLLENSPDEMVIADTYYNMGICYNETGNNKKALHMLNKGLKLVEQIDQKLSIRNFKKEIAATHFLLNDPGKAYQVLLEYTALQDKIYNNESIRQIAEMRTIYETEKKEEQIELLSKEQEIQEKKIKSQNLVLKRTKTELTIVSLIFVSSVVTFLLLRNKYLYRQREIINNQKLQHRETQLQSVIIAQEKERERLARDIHDSVGSGLSALKMNLSNLEPGITNHEFSGKNHYANSVDILDEIHREIRSISFNLKPKIIESRGLLEALEEMIRRINNIDKVNIELDTYNFNRRLPGRIEINVYRILQEILNNILKHSDASMVWVQINCYDNEINIMIEDDGIGFDLKLLHKLNSHGWSNIISRLELLKGTYEIDSLPGRKGNTITIDIPITHEEN